MQLEMELVHGSLEDEVLDVAPDSLAPSPPTGLLGRTGTSDEVRSSHDWRLRMRGLLAYGCPHVDCYCFSLL